MNLNNLKIGVRLSVGFGAVLSLLLVMVGVAYFHMVQTAQGMETLTISQQRADNVDEWQRKTQLNLTRAVAIAKAAGQPGVEAYFSPLIKETSKEISELAPSQN